MKLLNKTINDITVKDAVRVYVLFQSLFLAKKFVAAIGKGVANGTADRLSDSLEDLTKKITKLTDNVTTKEVDEIIDVEDLEDVDDLGNSQKKHSL